MALTFRLARPEDYPRLETLIIDSFEPITPQKKLDARIGPLNGVDWRSRWKARLAKAFATELVLLGEQDGEIVAYCSGTLDPQTKLATIDILAVDPRFHGSGHGRAMLRAMLERMRQDGARYADLECLDYNDPGNALYESEGFFEAYRQIRWFKTLE